MDLSKVVFIDSMSLGTLVKAASDLAKLKGKFMVAGTQEPVRRTLALTRMDKLFHTFPTVDEVIEELTSTPKA
jgi:anti-sigma B factor antagonist